MLSVNIELIALSLCIRFYSGIMSVSLNSLVRINLDLIKALNTQHVTFEMATSELSCE